MTNNFRPRLAALLLVILSSEGAAYRVWAAAEHPLCRFATHEEQVELEEQQLLADLAASTAKAAEEIFSLVEDLWEHNAIERLAYLGFKHDRDIARLELERQGRLLERQTSVVEQYRLQCAAFAAGTSTGDQRRTIEAVYLEYSRADCAALEVEVEIGRVDTAFRVEMLESVRDLRAGDVATRQDVIVAIRDLEMARKRLDSATLRTEACRRKTAPAVVPPRS